jgi:2-keto-4-pentenoate hydratase/2-oxohepta-3-ene-1,7-dioic acid hydratase in catechol pathway
LDTVSKKETVSFVLTACYTPHTRIYHITQKDPQSQELILKIATVFHQEKEVAGLITTHGCLPIPLLNQRLNQDWPTDLLQILVEGQLEEIQSWFHRNRDSISQEYQTDFIPPKSIQYAPLYRQPRKIWGIGLNYKTHADDLSEELPQSEPASFMKPDTTIIGPGDTINIPILSERTTGEAELGLIIGKECKDVPREDWLSVLAGFTNIIDMTAEDILRRNPRNLTQAKSFDTFFSFGPILYTPDEVDQVFDLQVETVINGKVEAKNTVSYMNFPLDFLVSYHSQIMTLLPGDIISSGTPGAFPLTNGDVIECRISGFQPLKNNVIDLKY